MNKLIAILSIAMWAMLILAVISLIGVYGGTILNSLSISVSSLGAVVMFIIISIVAVGIFVIFPTCLLIAPLMIWYHVKAMSKKQDEIIKLLKRNEK